jgi:hypothetical protein
MGATSPSGFSYIATKPSLISRLLQMKILPYLAIFSPCDFFLDIPGTASSGILGKIGS